MSQSASHSVHYDERCSSPKHRRPTPSAGQALTDNEDHKRALAPRYHHRHTNSLGLPSPNPSSTSLSLSSSSASISPAPTPASSSRTPSHYNPYHAPRTPHTPLRSASAASLASSSNGAAGSTSPASPRARVALLSPAPRTPARPLSPSTPRARPSPLFRLLLPFASSSGTASAPSSPTPTPSTSKLAFTSMTLHHPTPQHAHQSPPSTSQRPPSRSERLLRDALQRDEKERNHHHHQTQLPSSPLVSAHTPTSPPRATHKRRHSHVPTTTTNMASPRMDVAGEEYARGSFLFRTAMSNPRSPSPPHGPSAPFYGGDAEGSAPTTPNRIQHQHQRHTPQQQQDELQQRDSAASRRTRSVQSDERSPSPSPMRRRRQGSQNRPSPLVLDDPLPSYNGASNLQRHHTGHESRASSQQARQAHLEESPSRRSRPPPIPLDPQEHPPYSLGPGEPLVMTPHGQVLKARLERVLQTGRVVEQKERESKKGREDRSRSQSGSRTNEVRDEEGGWPWRERERTEREREAPSVISSPLNSSNSGSSSHSFRMQQSASYNRSRSKTDPVQPTSAAVPSPRRSTTAPAPSTSTASRRAGQIQYTGTTPPLVADVSPILGPSMPTTHEGEGEEDGDLRLLTPPPTPPFTARVFSFGGGAAREGYCPSPYKTRHDQPNPYATSRRVPMHSALGNARRPANAPVGQYSSSERDQDQESSSSSSSSPSFPPSATSSTDAHVDPGTAHPPLSPPAHPGQFSVNDRPTFNARKASAQCRAMDGYVSFASVEGLGAPPADPMSPVEGPDGADDARSRGAGGVLAAWGGGWKKLLGVAGVAGSTTESNTTGPKEGGVVL